MSRVLLTSLDLHLLPVLMESSTLSSPLQETSEDTELDGLNDNLTDILP
jgi:hypothetical protein